MNPRPFFGGAMECHVPSDWRDLSDIRQVPDHQECWQSPTGQVLVVEILERQSFVTDAQAAEYFFRDLAEANGVVVANSEMEFQTMSTVPQLAATQSSSSSSPLPDTAKTCGGIGRQLVRQGRDTDVAGNPRQVTAAWVRIDLCVLRLPHVNSEILLTLTSPTTTSQPGASLSEWDELFVQMLQSFCIKDWTLFG